MVGPEGILEAGEGYEEERDGGGEGLLPGQGHVPEYCIGMYFVGYSAGRISD